MVLARDRGAHLLHAIPHRGEDMTVTRQSLVDEFKLVSDDDLLAQFRSGELTDLAEDVVRAELQQRGLDPGAPSGEPPPQAAIGEASEASPDDSAGDLVLVATFLNPIDGQMLRSRLEAEGVAAMVADANMTQVNQLLTLAVGGVRVLVPQAQAARAREIAAAVQRGDYRLDDQVDVGEPSPEN
jgi:Putative prokaryotic signal transducing protein